MAENSAAGSAVGNPVTAATNPGNRVTYSLEGEDAQHFDIEADSGQLLVGEDLVLDHEGGPERYTVVVVADPRSGPGDRITVTINVTDAPESGLLTLAPAGAPAAGRELTAAVSHPEGAVRVVSWQWQRSVDGADWQVIEGADGASYTPTEADAGHRLRVIVLYRPPGDEETLVLTGAVTEALGGTPAEPPAETGEAGAGEAAVERASLYLLPLEGVTVGQVVAAVFTHPGGRPGNVSWQWQRSVDGADWQVIEGADRDHYVPTAADAGHRLRVIVSYQAPGGGLKLAGAATGRLPGTPAVGTAPAPGTVPTPAPSQASQPLAEPTPAPVADAGAHAGNYTGNYTGTNPGSDPGPDRGARAGGQGNGALPGNGVRPGLPGDRRRPGRKPAGQRDRRSDVRRVRAGPGVRCGNSDGAPGAAGEASWFRPRRFRVRRRTCR